MRLIWAWIVLVLSLCGCAGQKGYGALATGDQRPKWEQMMDQARRNAADGRYTALLVSIPPQSKSQAESRGIESGVYVFYNNPGPFCYMYMIPGEWHSEEEAGLYQSKDNRTSAGVLFRLVSELEGFEGTTLIERMSNRITQDHEKATGLHLAGVELVLFESARTGSWKWKAAPLQQTELTLVFGTKIILEIRPDAVAQITVSGEGDNDGLARRIIEGLRTTSDPTCYWAQLEATLKAIFGTR